MADSRTAGPEDSGPRLKSDTTSYQKISGFIKSATSTVTLKDIEQILQRIKPINAISILRQFWRHKTLKQAAASVIKLLELWDLFWDHPTDVIESIGKFIAFSFKKAISLCEDLREFVKSFMPADKPPQPNYWMDNRQSRAEELREKWEAEQEAARPSPFPPTFRHGSAEAEFHGTPTMTPKPSIFTRIRQSQAEFMAQQEEEMVNHAQEIENQAADEYTFESFLEVFQKLFNCQVDQAKAASADWPELTKSVVLTVAGLAVPIAVMGSGFASVDGKTTLDSIIKLGNVTKASNEIVKSFSGVSDLVKNFVGSMLGMKDETPKGLIIDRLEILQAKLKQANLDFDTNVAKVISDPNWMRNISALMEETDKLVGDITRMEGSTHSLMILYNIVKGQYQILEKKHKEMVRTLIGKQVPSTLYLYGPTGIGKSKLVEYIVEQLSIMEGRQILQYVRAPSDAYWSGYNGQDIVIYDDFNSNRNNVDHGEIVQIYTPAAFLLNQAGIPEKGMRFSSPYMIMCSNMGYAATSIVLSDTDILSRRRDFCICVEETQPFPDGATVFPAEHYKADFSHLKFTVMQNKPVNGIMVPVAPMSIQNIIREMYELSVERGIQFRAAVDARLKQTNIRNVADLPVDVSAQLPPAPQVRPVIVTQTARAATFNPNGRPHAERHEEFDVVYQRVISGEGWFRSDGQQGWFRAEYRRRFGLDFDVQYQLVQPGFDNGDPQYQDPHGDQFYNQAIEPTEMTTSQCFLFIGPPGIGKTYIMQQFNGSYMKLDEIAANVDTLRDAKNTVWSTYDGSLKKPVIMTCNQAQLARTWSEAGFTEDTYHALLRRCHVFTFNFARKGILSRYTKDELLRNSEFFATKVVVRLKKPGCTEEDFAVGRIRQHIEESILCKQARGEFVPDSPPSNFEPDFQILLDLPTTTECNGVVGFEMFKFFRYATILKAKGSPQRVLQNMLEIMKNSRVKTYADIAEMVSTTLVPGFGSVSMHFNDNIRVFFWEEEGRARVWKEELQFVKIEKSVRTEYPDITMFKSDCSIPWLDAFTFLIKCGIAFFAIYLDQHGDPITNEGTWADKMEEIDPVDAYEDYAMRVRAERPLSASVMKIPRMNADVSGSGLHGTRSSGMVSEATLDVYNQTRVKPTFPIVDERSINLASVSGQGLVEAQKRKFVNESSIDPGVSDVIDLVGNNVVDAMSENGTVLCNAIMLKGHLGVTNCHVSNSLHSVRYDGITVPVKIIHRNVDHDHCFFTTPVNSRNFKTISHHLLPERGPHEDLSGNYAFFLRVDGNKLILQNMKLKENISRDVEGVKRYGFDYTGHSSGLTTGPVQTKKGDCGCPIFIINPSYPQKLLGFHSGGNSTVGMGVRLYQSDLPVLNESNDQSITVLPHQSVHLFEEPLDIEGSLIKVVGQPLRNGKPFIQFYPTKTKYHNSPFAGLQIGESFEPSILSRFDSRCTVADPLELAIMKWDRPHFDIDFDLLDHVADAIAEHLAVRVKHSNYKVRVLTKLQAINRCTDIPGSNPIYRQSSPGFPWTAMGVLTKAKLFTLQDDGIFHIAETEHGRLLHHSIDKLISTAKRRERSAVVFHGALKDEPLKLLKIAQSASRSIIASPIDYTLADRMYRHSVSAVLTTIFREIPIKIGIDPLSSDWQGLYDWHVEVGEAGFDCDFKAWDATVPMELMQRLPRIYNRIHQVCDKDWKPEDDLVRYHLHECMHGAFVLYKDVILQMPGGQMTGQPQTALDNSLINWIYAGYTFIKLARVHAPKLASFYHFMKYVRCSFYGDDNMITVHPALLEWFNFDSYSRECSLLGLTVTPADKGMITRPYKDMAEMNFLKRTFKRLSVSRRYFGALDLNSIQRMMDWTTGKPHTYDQDVGVVSFDRRLIGDIVVNLLHECAVHGRDLYDKVFAHLVRCADLYDIDLPLIPRYEEALLCFFD